MNIRVLLNFFAILNIVVLLSCSTTGKVSGTTDVNEEVEGSESVNGQQSGVVQQDSEIGRYGETPEDSVICIRNLSLYSEYYRQNNYELAYPFWQKALQICPRASQNLYIHGARLLRLKINAETDKEAQDALVDSLMWLFDARIEHFGREGFVLGRKAVDLYTFRSDEETRRIYKLSSKSIESEGNDSRADVLVVNMQTAVRLAQAGMKEDIEIFNIFDRARGIVDHNVKHDPQRANVYERSMSQIESLFRPFSSCDNLVEAYAPRFEDNPNDTELLEEITTMLDESDCTEEELFFLATKKLHKIQPTAESAFLMGRLESNNENYRAAVEYFKQATELYNEEKDKDQLYRSYMLKADIQSRQLNQFVSARENALKAAEIMPDDGRPYMVIAEMYARTAKDCGDNDFTERVAYWAAVDMLVKARNASDDTDIIERVEDLISSYRRHFPDRETIFFHGYEEGDRYRVECWINQTTTVRAR